MEDPEKGHGKAVVPMGDLEKMELDDDVNIQKSALTPETSSADHSINEEEHRNGSDPNVPSANPKSVLVDWDGPDDPADPRNFSRPKKFLITCTMAGLNLTFTFGSSIFSAATLQTSKRFDVSPEVMVLATSLYLLGFGIGPTLFGPLSELYGRKRPLFAGFIIFAILQIPVAVATNIQSVMIFRFLQGFFGSSTVAIVGGALADFWNARERGFAMPSFAGTLFAGPIFGPIVGAYIVDSHLGWRWTQWITLILAGFLGMIAFICVPETYAPVLLSRKAARLRHETGNWALHAKHEERKVDFNEIATKYLVRPAKMMFQEPILALLTVYLSFVFGLIYLFFEAYPISFSEERGMSPGVASLTFISILIGVFCGCALLAFTTTTRLAPNPQEGRYQETRLLLMIAGAVALPIGLFWFAWTSSPSISPWPQIIAGVPIGFSVITITLQGLNYIIDCYSVNANSALAAMTFVRSWFGAGFPLFAAIMFRELGVPWATSTLAFISLALIPVPVFFYKFGAKIRSMSKYVPN